MATKDSELKTEVSNYIEDTRAALSQEAFDQAFTNAKRHISIRKDVDIDTFDFYDATPREDALFWWTCVFAKVATGELDTGDVQVGAIDIEGILAVEDGEVTTWVRKATSSTRSIDTGSGNSFGFGITSPTRENRDYESDDDTGVEL